MFPIKLSGGVEINPGLQGKTNQNLQRRKFLKCASVNVKSLTSAVKSMNGKTSNHLLRFQNFVYTEDINIIFSNETWLSNSVQRVEILHSEQTIREIKHNYDLEFILVQLTTMSNCEILICSCYRPPNAKKLGGNF